MASWLPRADEATAQQVISDPYITSNRSLALSKIINTACLSDTDFTLLFEEIALNIIPCVLFVFLAIFRVLVLRAGKNGQAGGETLKYSKLVSHRKRPR